MANVDVAFVGSVPELYTRYMGPMFFEPYAEDLANRLGGMASGKVLETACGTGIVTRALVAALPDTVAITATDLNQPMLDFAKSQPGGEGADWQQADAQNLPFPDRSFDIVVCQFGVMFFPDKEKAYCEALRVLKPHGRFLFNVWDRIDSNDLTFIVHRTLQELYPDDPPGFLVRTPFGYHDVDTIRADLAGVGFTESTVDTLKLPCRTPFARYPALGLIQGSPLGAEIAARDATGLNRAVAAAARTITERFGRGPIEASMQAHVFSALRPPG
jgi:SAM-dependent methyltransferase